MTPFVRTLILAIAGVLLLGAVGFAYVKAEAGSAPQGSVAAAAICSQITAPIPLIGKAAYAEDISTGKVLYESNADAQLPLASLTKLMTVLVASSILTPDDTVTVTPDALTPDTDTNGLVTGEAWRAQDLTDFTLTVSANDGAHALALAAGQKAGITEDQYISKMNAEAARLGMRQTFYMNDTGLDISTTTAGAYGSAHDIAALFTYLAKNEPRLIESTTADTRTFVSLSGVSHDASNTSPVISGLDGAIGSKTGYTDLAGGNLAVVFEPILGHPIVAVVLGSTRDGRNTDMQALAKAAQAFLKTAIICESAP